MKDQEYITKHPQYLADGGGLFGAPPQLVCQYCGKRDYELFYGHCRPCAKLNNVPMKMPEPQAFHDAFAKGTSTIIEGMPKEWTPSLWQRLLSKIGLL
jgi:hypothetical protein